MSYLSIAGYAGSVDSSRRGSRDDLSEISRPAASNAPTDVLSAKPLSAVPRPRAQVPERTMFPYNPPAASAGLDYNNDGYSTDHSPKPSPQHSAEQYQPAQAESDAYSEQYRPAHAESDAYGGRHQQPTARPLPTNELYQPATAAQYRPRTELYQPASTQYQPRQPNQRQLYQPRASTEQQHHPTAVQSTTATTSPDPNDPNEHAYVNTSQLHKRAVPETQPEPAVDLEELKRRELYSQRRPTRPAPSQFTEQAAKAQARPAPRFDPSASRRGPDIPPSYDTAMREGKPSVRARTNSPISEQDYRAFQNPGFGLATHDSFSTVDTKSVDSFDTESDYSMSKPPLSYRPYDHVRQYSDEKKPFETDIDSMYSEDQADNTPLYRHRPSPPTQTRRADREAPPYTPSPLARALPSESHPSDAAARTGYIPPPSRSHMQYDTDGDDGTEASYGYRVPNAETDIDAMSDMTDDWHRKGPPVETDF